MYDICDIEPVKCPWCGEEIPLDGDLLDLEEEGTERLDCPSCGKPVALDISVELSVDVEAREDELAVAAERALYERRMRGDWT